MHQLCAQPAALPACRGLSERRRFCCARSLASADISTRSTITYINRSVRDDEHVEAPGSVVVHGNVAASSSIEAAGDVMVWGRLSGHVHAGCSGDRSAHISALELRGAQLVIAHSTSMGAARITVPGPHTASVQQAGRSLTMNLTPLGPSHPPLNPIGLTSSVKRWLSWYPAAGAALLTGCYAMLAGLALMVAPKTVLGLLFDASLVPAIWIRVGGVLFATFGAQYLGTAIADYRQVLAASTSSSGCPDMPFRPASPHTSSTAPQQTHTAPPAVAATFQQHATASGHVDLASTAAAMLHDSSSAYVDFSASLGSSDGPGRDCIGSSDGNGVNSSSSSGREGGGNGSTTLQVGRSVPADELTKDQVEQLRQMHKRRHKEATAAAAAAGAGSHHAAAGNGNGGVVNGSSHRQSSSRSQAPTSSVHAKEAQQQQQQQQQHQPQQQQLIQPLQQALQQQAPPTWAYCSAGFYEASVWARLGLAAAFVLLVAVCKAPPGLIILALINLMGALSMWGALRRQWLMHVMGDMPDSALAYDS